MKEIKSFIVEVLLLIGILLLSSQIEAFDNIETHPKITEQAIKNSRLEVVLTDRLGLTGLNEAINNKPILKWITEGARDEDIPACRASNHFHDPIKNMGLSDVIYSAADPCGILMPGPIIFPCSPAAINIGRGFLAYCAAEGALSGRSYIPWSSTVTWATGYISAGNPAKITTTKWITGNEWDWDRTRNAYYLALVSSPKQNRDNYLAVTFFGLGHTLHLLQDMAVPAHVRNDFLGHVVPERFEAYVRDHAGDLIKQYPAIEITNASYTNFWDSDLYDGTNPSITMLLPGLTESNLMAGLAEYANANFLSKNTMLTEDYLPYGPYYFPYPRAASTALWKDSTNNKKYLRKTGDGETVDHLAVSGLLDWYRIKYFPQEKYYRPIGLDDRCFYDYARRLLPRAVGYSAGLLNYFFRGDIDMVDDDATGSGYVIVNNTDEDMSGIFELYYDNTRNERVKVIVPAFNLPLSIGKKSSGNNKSTNITFTSPTDAKDPGKYMLVFSGKLGSEEGAVAGKIIELKGISGIFLITNGQQLFFNVDIDKDLAQYKIKPLKNKIAIEGSSSGYPCTVVSNPDNTKHFVTYPSTYDKDNDYIKHYGVMGGTKYVWRPENFSENSKYILSQTGIVYDQDYTYVAFGRHNFTLDENGKMLSYDESIWKKNISSECSSDYIYRYKTSQSGKSFVNGQVVASDQKQKGTKVYIPGQGWTSCSGPMVQNTLIAATGNNATLFLKEENHPKENKESFHNTLQWPYITYTTNMCLVKHSGTVYMDYYLYSREQKNKISLTMGGIGIDSINFSNIESAIGAISCSHETLDKTLITCEAVDMGNYTPTLIDVPSGPSSHIKEDAGIRVFDYDNINGNDAFIILYALSKYSFQEDISFKPLTMKVVYTLTSCPLRTLSGETEDHQVDSVSTDYYYLERYKAAYKTSLNSEMNNITIYEETTKDDNLYNKILTGFSTQMNKEMIVYTYNINKWNGSEYIFDKHMIGIINISDKRLPEGYRQEFNIDSDYISIDDFDYTRISGIGIQKSQ